MAAGIMTMVDNASSSCQECTAFQAQFSQASMLGFARDIPSIDAGANSGCHSCAIYQAMYRQFVAAGLLSGPIVPVYLSMAPASRRKPSALAVIPKYTGPSMQFLLRPAEEVEHLLLPRSVHIESRTDSEASFDRLRDWMHTCSSKHASCRRPSLPLSDKHQQAGRTYRPTRLLRISSSDPSTAASIRLCEGDSIPPDVVYATLTYHSRDSHSSSSTPQSPLALTKARMTSFKACNNNIPLASLSQTFQDTIRTARRLGIWYLWIDTLCIVQDSPDDVARESSLMPHIYGNSLLNIAATVSSSVDGAGAGGGLFRERNRLALRPLKIRIGGKDDEKKRDFYLVDADPWREAFEIKKEAAPRPLNSLSRMVAAAAAPRVVHFDTDQLVWECNELTACERYPAGLAGLATAAKEDGGGLLKKTRDSLAANHLSLLKSGAGAEKEDERIIIIPGDQQDESEVK
ncbi:hypothetical protein B0H63DRAFT_516124 [Podospora didyma]|uniref:Heterokaryon incompatibility domain-containing protein n=1 Tax=Podospora didyma TaxID=330526 RepID=A0AAE0P3V8_9PEZI|nr:hypothetical protein B0H63DRAFT_516124 [Podospora didyma]